MTDVISEFVPADPSTYLTVQFEDGAMLERFIELWNRAEVTDEDGYMLTLSAHQHAPGAHVELLMTQHSPAGGHEQEGNQ